MSSYATIDLETSIKNRGEDAVGKNKASPFHKENKICYTGMKSGGVYEEWESVKFSRKYLSIPYHVKMLVGANIKFDLLYLMRDYEYVREWLKTGRIWDVQLAEYLLTGQEHKWAKLDDLAVKYGGSVKDDRLKELWDNDVDTEDIDPDIISPYLEGDVLNTELVFKKQIEQAKDMDMLPLMWEQMDALLATTEMEFNGMAFDKGRCLRDSMAIMRNVDSAECELTNTIADVLDIDYTAANCSSVDQVSKTLFGGEVTEKVDQPVLNDDGTAYRFKSGKRKGEVKTVLKNVFKHVRGFGFTPLEEWKTKKEGVYKVNDDVLKALRRHPNIEPDEASFIETLMYFRKLNKDLKTYYIGYSNLVWHDGCIHPQFNHCATATGRLSHSAPNLGNVSHSKEDD
ncbi:DNA polymerase [Gammaproteobacteria bacterium]|nr:DNA polymerase [Gammaproteobacteria bacterium]